MKFLLMFFVYFMFCLAILFVIAYGAFCINEFWEEKLNNSIKTYWKI